MPVYEYYGKNNKRTWYVEAFLGIDPVTGKKIIEKKRGFTTKREALAYETEILFKKNNKTIVKPSSKLLSELLAEWLKVKRRENEIGEQTWQVYDTNIRVHINPCIGNVKLSKLNVLHIEKLMDQLDEKGLASGTRKKIYNIMNNALSEAVRKKEVAENVVAPVKKPKVTYKKIEVWDKETVKRFVTDAKGLSRYYMAYYLPLVLWITSGRSFGA